MSEKTKNARVLIVDDHPVVRQGLVQTIGGTPGLEVCGEAADAEEAFRLIEELQPDLALIDITLGGTSGIDLIKQVKAAKNPVKMLVNSMHDESLYAERALRAGSMGYINKGEAMDNIIEAIHCVMEGKIYLSERMRERMLQNMTGHRGENTLPSVADLTDRELEVFGLYGQGLNTNQVAAKLSLSPKTIATHREHIQEKLNINSNTELIRRAVQWVLEEGV